MISRRIAAVAHHASIRSNCLHPSVYWLPPPAVKHHRRSFADTIVKVPHMAESISEGTLKQFSKGVGDRIDVSVNAPGSGTITEIFVHEEDNVVVGQDLARIELGESPNANEKNNEHAQELNEEENGNSLALAKDSESEPERHIEPSSRKDHAASQGRPTQKPNESSVDIHASHNTSPTYPVLSNREERRIKMNRMRLRIAERLKQSQNTAASLTTFNEVDMSHIIEFRRLYLDETLKKTGVKLGFMGAFSRAAVLAMRDLPAVNASIEGPNGGDTIVYRDYVDISVAVATEKGLVTPVVRNVELLDMIGVERAIAEMGKKARDGRLSIEDMAGGTFTISNGGIFGSLMGTPIINLPQSAVLGLHAIKERPVAINGEVKIHPMMYLALTYDHRLLDGREAVQFLVKIKEYIEDPRRMLL
ncbi:hypothetical protein L249_7416 [Ophiocordyceps polyrhachis-furcata BCC 54312]|uniref:dihydrolipoyllysine-residue succinyltransferase n=1 Tax=Ophiocordyceps polyrhachis-furcata BCC 54312 TaxID=1330021 RepID=A0A367LAZ4_9HYPO|nr:hypothetical protein L249_7416 [Ophiocordyceps polyrhachis-furcata BCC 54312]